MPLVGSGAAASTATWRSKQRLRCHPRSSTLSSPAAWSTMLALYHSVHRVAQPAAPNAS
jgi:hypothetical protein